MSGLWICCSVAGTPHCGEGVWLIYVDRVKQFRGSAVLMWNTVRVQPSLTLAAFSIVSQTGVVGGVGPTGLPIVATTTGEVGGRASGKLNFLWTDKFSSFIEGDGSTIQGTDAWGTTGGLRWTF
jgi:hypothetical protein